MLNSSETAFQMPEPAVLARPEQNNPAAIVQALAIPPWEATVEPGDTLDVLLSRAELDAQNASGDRARSGGRI